MGSDSQSSVRLQLLGYASELARETSWFESCDVPPEIFVLRPYIVEPLRRPWPIEIYLALTPGELDKKTPSSILREEVAPYVEEPTLTVSRAGQSHARGVPVQADKVQGAGALTQAKLRRNVV